MCRRENKIEIFECHAEIILEDRYGNERCRALVSLDKIELVRPYRWRWHGKYVRGKNESGEDIYLHRLITNCPMELEVDHKFHNTLDNRDDMLVVCTRQENMKNKRKKYNKRH